MNQVLQLLTGLILGVDTICRRLFEPTAIKLTAIRNNCIRTCRYDWSPTH